eukprot:CCRYP_014417-RA/>CCRYP_014417-RA protein AED:0.12 eAED:0.78 QI:0/0/0.33/1/0/0/3/41/93
MAVVVVRSGEKKKEAGRVPVEGDGLGRRYDLFWRSSGRRLGEVMEYLILGLKLQEAYGLVLTSLAFEDGEMPVGMERNENCICPCNPPCIGDP